MSLDSDSYCRALELCQALSGVFDCGFCPRAGDCGIHQLEQDQTMDDGLPDPVRFPGPLPPSAGNETQQKHASEESAPVCQICGEAEHGPGFRLRISLEQGPRGAGCVKSEALICVPCLVSDIVSRSQQLEETCVSMLAGSEACERRRNLWVLPGGAESHSLTGRSPRSL